MQICRGDGEEWGRSDGSKQGSRAGATRRSQRERETTVETIGYEVERNYGDMQDVSA
jgi:hypothetical protein